MISEYTLLFVNCDTNLDANCWQDATVQLEENETREEGLQFLEGMGWEFEEDILAVCPYCSKGIMKPKEKKEKRK